MNEKPKTIVILGQTSTGKSDFAVEVAREINGEVVSADSRQVYKGMDLGTGKITKKEMSGIPHYLLDVVSPKKVFSVSDFQRIANKKIREIIKDGKVPIICGGTGFYVDSLINRSVFPEVPPNKILRAELSKKTPTELFKILQVLDKDRSENIDKNNPIRLIRSIEIAKALGKVPKIIKSKTSTSSAVAELEVYNFDTLKIGLTIPSEILKEMIRARLLSRIQKGMIEEIENLHKNGLSWKRMESLGLEYRYVALYLQNKLTKDQMIEKLNTEIWHFAKRQKTWFKRDKSIIWINPLETNEKALALKKVKEFLK